MSAAGRRHYDLAEAGADLPEREGPPLRSILICSHPRSGSTLLGEMLHGAGGLGAPLEYFHVGFRPYLQTRLGGRTLGEYAANVHRRRTEADGAFSCKLFWRDLEEMAHERDPEGQPGFGARPPGSLSDEDYRRLWSLVEDVFPAPVFIHLRRQDRLRGAVSALIAEQDGAWRSIPGSSDQSPRPQAVYDADRIRTLMGVHAYCHAHWRGLFSALKIEPWSLTYEALDADPAGVSAALLTWLGSSAVAPAPRMQRQAGPRNEAMALRFIREQSRAI